MTPAMTRHFEHLGRRDFLQALAGAAALALPRTAGAQTGASATKLGERITLITGAGNNVLALAGDNGSLLVDAGDAAHAPDVLRLAGKSAPSSTLTTIWNPPAATTRWPRPGRRSSRT
jgi:hypothetical protein